jgi:hypothetical protein
MNEHPPIPPNDERFAEMGDGSVSFQWPTFGMGRFITPHSTLDVVTQKERTIIASVARCAWMDLERDDTNEAFLKYCAKNEYLPELWSSWREFIASVCGECKLWGEQK